MVETIWKDGVEYELRPVKRKKKEGKTKALFTLSMPGVNSWNGRWSGNSRCYCYEKLAFSYGKAKYPKLKEGNYGYDFEDGWFANVKVEFVTPSEARAMMKRSDGFCGYEWMCEEICKYGRILTRKERHEGRELEEKVEEIQEHMQSAEVPAEIAKVVEDDFFDLL